MSFDTNIVFASHNDSHNIHCFFVLVFRYAKNISRAIKISFLFHFIFYEHVYIEICFFFSISLSKRKLDTVFVIVRILIVAFTLTSPKQITGSTSEGINSTKRTKKVQNFLLHKNMLFSHHLRNMSNWMWNIFVSVWKHLIHSLLAFTSFRRFDFV